MENPGTHNTAGKKLNWQQFLATRARPMHGGFIANYRPDMMTRAAGAVSMKDIANLSHGDIRVELNRLADILAGQGHDIYVVDKTHPELDIPVVRIFSPKMRSLINSEIYDSFRAMAAVCHEAGNTRERDIFWRMHGMNSTNEKSPGTSPSTCFLIPPSSNAGHGIWGEDYRKTLLQVALSRRHLM